MALTFTDWENATDGVDNYVLDWTSAEAMRGKPAWVYVEALRQATNERLNVCGRNNGFWWSFPGIIIEDEVVPGLRMYGAEHGTASYDRSIPEFIDYSVERLMTATGESYGFWVDYLDNGGDWTNQSSVPKLDSIAAYEAFIGEPYVQVVSGRGVAEWARNQYLILNAMRRRSYFEKPLNHLQGIDIEAGGLAGWAKDNIDPTTGKGYSASDWAAAKAIFDSQPWGPVSTGPAWMARAYHRAFNSGPSTVPGEYIWNILRTKFDGYIANIPAHIAHQAVWYRYSIAGGRSIPANPIDVYSNNDFVNGESRLWPVYTSTVDTRSSRSGFVVGDYGDLATVDEPLIQSYWAGYYLHNFQQDIRAGSIGEVHLHWDVPGGFTFVT